jgi:hypothetical protein
MQVGKNMSIYTKCFIFLIASMTISCNLVKSTNNEDMLALINATYDATIFEIILSKCPPPPLNQDENLRYMCPDSYVFFYDSILLYNQISFDDDTLKTISISKNDIISYKAPNIVTKIEDSQGNLLIKDLGICVIEFRNPKIDKLQSEIDVYIFGLEYGRGSKFYFYRKKTNMPWRLKEIKS